MMRCPKCGAEGAKFKVQKKGNKQKKSWVRKHRKIKKKHRPRGGFKSQTSQKEQPRTNFEAICPKCTWEWVEDWSGTRIVLGEEKVEEETKVKNGQLGFYIFCSLKKEKMIREAGMGCNTFLPIDVSEKRRCFNCVYAESVEE